MFISVSGYNWTGSSAVFDLLQEYEETECTDGELTITYMPGGIIDLERDICNGTTYFSGDAGICRFNNFYKHCEVPGSVRQEFISLSMEYVDRIVTEKWDGISFFDVTRMSDNEYKKWTNKRLLLQVLKWPRIVMYKLFRFRSIPKTRTMYLAQDKEKFEKETKWYLSEVIKLYSRQQKPVVVLRQFVSAFQPSRCMKYLPSGSKTIVVDRDPRDVYLLGKQNLVRSCYPCFEVDKFIEYYKSCWGKRETEMSDNVLRVRFEDLIYKYDDTVQIIEQFCGISKHKNIRKIFQPEKSINNTQLKVIFPQYEDEIKKIEEALPELLYDFPKTRRSNGKIF